MGEEALDKRLKSEMGSLNAVVAGLSSIKMIFSDMDKLGTKYGIRSTDELDDLNLSFAGLAAPNVRNVLGWRC